MDQEINNHLSSLLTKAIHSGSPEETEKILKLIQEIQGSIQVEYIENNSISN